MDGSLVEWWLKLADTIDIETYHAGCLALEDE